MKLHDLKPAEGSRSPRKRVGRGIAAGQGKTAGRGTKGQKARAGGSIPPWFEGGQTPLHQRIPKLRGFKNRFKVDYEVVNIGRIGELALLGAFESGESPGGKTAKAAPVTVNQDILRAVGLVRTLSKPLKVLGHGDIDVALFVVADAFSKSAVAKIEAAGGSVQLLEVPTEPLAALGLESAVSPASKPKAKAEAATPTAPQADETVEAEEPVPPKASKVSKAPKASTSPKSKAETGSAEPAPKKARAKGKADGAAPAAASPVADATPAAVEPTVAATSDAPADEGAADAAADDSPTTEDA